VITYLGNLISVLLLFQAGGFDILQTRPILITFRVSEFLPFCNSGHAAENRRRDEQFPNPISLVSNQQDIFECTCMAVFQPAHMVSNLRIYTSASLTPISISLTFMTGAHLFLWLSCFF